MTPELWHRILGVNLLGTFSCVQRLAPGMLERGFGRIVAVSSNSALGGTGSPIPYVVSKGALNTLVVCLARALAPTVQVNAVAPGWMRTPWIGSISRRRWPSRSSTAMLTRPDVEDVAAVVVGLAGNRAVTGQVVVVDRGELAWQEGRSMIPRISSGSSTSWPAAGASRSTQRMRRRTADLLERVFSVVDDVEPSAAVPRSGA